MMIKLIPAIFLVLLLLFGAILYHLKIPHIIKIIFKKKSGNLSEINQTRLRVAEVIGVILIGIITIMFLFNQTSILDKQKAISETQTDILRSTSQSLRPTIILTPYQINYEYYLSNGFLQNGDNLEIAIINLGETIAPLVNVQIIDSNFYGGKSKDIENLESLEYFRANFTIMPSNKEAYPGLYNVTFIVRCPLCEKEFDYQNIPICLYGQNFSISECEY